MPIVGAVNRSAHHHTLSHDRMQISHVSQDLLCIFTSCGIRYTINRSKEVRIMAIERVREYLRAYGREQDIIELDTSSATVELAATALHTKPERIAKSLSFMGKEQPFIVVCAGDCKVDNHKFKETFHVKPKMLKGDEVERCTNHAIGGVCPFAVPEGTAIYLDASLRRFDHVFPACGSANSAIRVSCEELETLVPRARWVDVCKQEAPQPAD